MTRRRWIADEVNGDRAVLTGRNAAHLARVLRARVGQEFDIACGEVVRLGRIVQVAGERVEFALGNVMDTAAPTPVEVTLVLAVFKFDRMEWAIEKASELGVAAIVPVIARRTDAHLATAAVKRAERWRRIATAAARQSRRVAAPEIASPLRLKDSFALFQADAARIVLSEIEKTLSLTKALAANTESRALVIAVGPEGGWTPEELEMFSQAGWTAASLGTTILRAETAAIAALAIATAELTTQVLPRD